MGGCSVSTELAAPTAVPSPQTLVQAIAFLENGSPEQRITAALAIPTFGADAKQAVLHLEANLYYEGSHDVRRSAAVALGEIGQPASSAGPSLVDVLDADPSVSVRVAAADALGGTGYKPAVPDLVAHLGDESIELQIASAWPRAVH
jgi:HEAT repeat protein